MNVNSMTDALIIVDVQNDFCPGGALAVKKGDEIIPVINKLQMLFHTIIFTRDWHPPDHISFSSTPSFTDKSWPPHCVRNTKGAAFHESLHIPDHALIIDKATKRDEEAYSGFQGTHLDDIMKSRGIQRVFVTGLATDYCVKFTALDARKLGFSVVIIEDAVRGVDVPEGSVQAAVMEMKKAGCRFIHSRILIPDQ